MSHSKIVYATKIITITYTIVAIVTLLGEAQESKWKDMKSYKKKENI